MRPVEALSPKASLPVATLAVLLGLESIYRKKTGEIGCQMLHMSVLFSSKAKPFRWMIMAAMAFTKTSGFFLFLHKNRPLYTGTAICGDRYVRRARSLVAAIDHADKHSIATALFVAL